MRKAADEILRLELVIFVRVVPGLPVLYSTIPGKRFTV